MGELPEKRMNKVRLHIGSGDKHWPGFVNVDAYGDPDVLTDCRRLPFDRDYADEIHSIHFVEHIPRLEVDQMLYDWYRVLRSGGYIAIEVPCLDKIAANVIAGEKNMRLTSLGIFGDPRDPKPGMMHHWCYTKKELVEILEQVGFKMVGVEEPHFHMAARDMRVTGVKQ